MTDKELKRLSRSELLELLLLQTREVERLNKQVQSLQKQLEERQIKLDDAGNIAQASLQLSGVFEAAQKAADQYLENIAAMEYKSREVCQTMEAQTKEKCNAFIQKAQQEAASFWQTIREEIRNPYLDHERWQQIHQIITDNQYEKLEF